MKGKLIKTDVNFLLEDDKGVVIASTSLNKEGLSLSQKNCQAIERGYDLDELAMGYDLYENINFVGQMRAYKAGFQKALEILGDKKFSEEQLRESFLHVQNDPTFDVFKQSLQKTEWDVEVVMVPAMSNNGNVYYGDIPKLDADGCLILKRI
jgi:hypothetical protein